MVQRLIVVGLAVVALWFGWRWLFPNDEAQIRSVLERIAGGVGSGAEDEGQVSRLARVAGIRSALDPEITVDAGPPFTKMSGRDAIIGTVARMNSTIKELAIGFDDVRITLDPARTSAQVSLTAEARFRDAGGERGLEARELDVAFRKLEGDWVVSNVALVRTLEPVTPR